MTSDKDLTLHFFYSSTNWCMLSTNIISLLGFPRPVESSSVFKVVLGQIAKFEQVESHRYEAIWVCRPSEHILHPESTRNPGRWSVAGGWSGRIGSATWLASQNWLGGFHWFHHEASRAIQDSSTLQVGSSPFEDQLLSVLLEARSRRYGSGASVESVDIFFVR